MKNINTPIETLFKADEITQFSLGGYRSMALMKDGSIKMCGHNEFGELGLGHLTP